MEFNSFPVLNHVADLQRLAQGMGLIPLLLSAGQVLLTADFKCHPFVYYSRAAP